jgi:hypothetical protein
MFQNQKNVEKKFGSGRKCALSSSKAHATLKKPTTVRSAKSYRELGGRSKFITTLSESIWQRWECSSASKTTAPQKSVIKAVLKLLTQNLFSIKSIYKSSFQSYLAIFAMWTVCKYLWNDELRLKAMSVNSIVIRSLKIAQQQRMSILFAIPSSQRKFC